MSQTEIASSIAQCMAVPPLQRSVSAGRGHDLDGAFAIIRRSDYGFRGMPPRPTAPFPRSFAMSLPMSLLRADAFLSPLEIEAAVTRALDEDLGRAGDITSIATIPEDLAGRATVVARQAGVMAGLPLVAAAFLRLAPEIAVVPHARDGELVQRGGNLMTISGNARAILGAERVALNFIGHLSGIATATAAFVVRIAHTKARIVCTRKTTPGLRALEKYAVRCGGGYNHRFGLDDAILIKDNHIAVAGGIKAVLERAKGAAGHLVKLIARRPGVFVVIAVFLLVQQRIRGGGHRARP